MPLAYIALGSNLGEREANLRAALALLEARAVKVRAVSTLRDTEPVGAPAGTEHLRYLNGAAKLETTLEPRELLAVLLDVERALGRNREQDVRNAPRTVDLDLILYEDRVIGAASGEGDLCLPHPRMHQRRFVLEPLAELAPDLPHPVLKKTVAQLLAECPKT
ncbi:MAG: 2-amino-4-hydroxy-6-hydroxymethyldihydropteridine diphosphokinase [Planctomycetes bacterium]|nr:2-amino-4-hydroxy-6-hydroxymethyldihydropteridine diphosphokinase [Planctomycetota bacterium]